MTNKSAKEVLSDYEAVFGPKDGPIIRNLTDKVSNLALRWGVFLYFFAGRKERVEVLNEASGFTANLLQGLLWDNALMRIRQLTDPEKTKNNDNLSLQHLVRIAKKYRDIDLSEAHETTFGMCRISRDYAAKYLAHMDLAHSLGDKKTRITRGQTTEAIRAICKFVQEFHLRVRDVDCLIMPIMSSDDHQQFLLRLYQGNQAEKTFRAESYAAAMSGDQRALKRTDIPDWVRENRNPLDLF